MTKIRFYVIPQANDWKARFNLVCTLTEKALQHNMRVYIQTADESVSQQLDEFMWLWNERSFLAHEMAPGSAVAKVLIGNDYEPIKDCDYLINLSSTCPAFFSRFERMAEILDQTPEILSQGRERYRFYQERGYELHYHKM